MAEKKLSDCASQSSATVENITTRLGAHTIRDDDDKADSRSIPNSRPDVSSANPIFKVIQPKDQRRFFRKGKVCPPRSWPVDCPDETRRSLS